MKLIQNEVKPDLLVGKERELYDMACDFHKGYTALGGLWRRMFSFVRDNNLSPERVDLILEAAGFNRQRACEMRRVCATDDQTAKLYTAKQIGFRVVLDIEREKKRKAGGKKAASLMSRLRQRMFDAFAKGVHRQVVKPFFTTMGDWALLVIPMTDLPASLKSPADVSVTNLEKLAFVKPKQK